MDKTTHPYFVPDETQGNRRDTATLLVGTATEHDIPQREVAATQGGFRISENVYKALGWADDEVDDTVGDADARVIPGTPVAPSEVLTGQVPVDGVGASGFGTSGFGEDTNPATDPVEDDLDTLAESEADEADDEPESPLDEDIDADVPTEDEADEQADSNEVVLPYDQWDYKDLKAEVIARDLATDDLKTATLVAALTADDARSTTV